MSKKDQISETLKKLKTHQLHDDIFLIEGENKGTFPYSNSLLIIDKDVILIDSGIGDDIALMLSDYVDVLINSHYHIDHILGNYLFKELWIVEEEKDVTSSFENYKEYAGIADTVVEKEWLSWFSQFFDFHPSTPNRTFKPNQEFDFGNTSWKAVHIPGHSPDHCAFYEPDRKIMFASDIDLTPFGPWYGNPNADLKKFIASIKMLREYDIDIICSSHSFPQTQNIHEALDDYLNIIYNRDERILDLLDEKNTLDDLESANIIYKESKKVFKAFAWFEKRMIEKHLDILLEIGRIERLDDGFIRI
jgi:glyoxylase-like metal-dependent hydrolase (beta-lactamase superfamily II)